MARPTVGETAPIQQRRRGTEGARAGHHAVWQRPVAAGPKLSGNPNHSRQHSSGEFRARRGHPRGKRSRRESCRCPDRASLAASVCPFLLIDQPTRRRDPVKKTPLNAVHRQLGGRMVEFGGWEMPLQYKGILEEHKAVRERVGIFDTTHMGEFVVQGPDALRLLQYATTNNVAALEAGQAQYSFFCNPEGGVEDDCLVYRFLDHHYVVVNAAPLDADFARLQRLAAEQ